MTFKKAGLILFLIFFLLPMQKIFAQTANTGFVQANLWYSKDPFEEGDRIKIYTLIFNPDTKQLSGTVNFFDNTTLLGKKDFSVAGGATNAISIGWTVTAGDHNIFGEIQNPRFLLSNGNYQTISLTENQTQKSSRTVSKKITSGQTNTSTIPTSISDVTKIIENNVPNSVTQPIISATDKLEEIRNNISNASDNKQKEIKNDIKTLENPKSTSKDSPTQSTFLKPFKYVELFFLSIFSYIINNKILFYGIIIVVVFFILRFVWKKIF
jgi:hypothetical protein